MTRSLIKVLLIEDDPGYVQLIREIVQEDSNGSMDLIHAECLSEGKKMMALSKIDVVLLDLTLPDSAAWDTVSQAEQMVSSIPIIVLTGLDDETMANRIIYHGVQDCFIKGEFDSRMLRRSIRYAMERKRASVKKDQLLADLRKIHARAKILQGLLPICATCKKIRNDQGYWHQVENYICDHSGAIFTHSICPDCARQLYPELFPDPQKEKKDMASAIGNGQSMVYTE